MQDLLETTHFLTRLKVAPDAEGFFDGGSSEAKRSAEMAAKLSVPSLTRAWQLLLKGLFEVRDSTHPLKAAEMALIRLAYAADLPPTDKLVRDVMDGAPAPRGPAAPSSGGGARAMGSSSQAPMAQRAPEPTMAVQNGPVLRTLEDLAALAVAKGSPILKVHIENDMHLVSMEPGRIEFRPSARAPRTLSGDLAQRLKDWTGQRWMVTVAKDGGAPTIAESKKSAHQAKLDAVLQEPMVRAVLDRFPGSEVIAVRDLMQDDIATEVPESSEDA
jgi:DNA polymerase-3 subunit gamma/tau